MKKMDENPYSNHKIYYDEKGAFVFSRTKKLPNGTVIYPKKAKVFKIYI